MHKLYGLLAAGLRRRDSPELIDLPGVDAAELRGNLLDLSRINALGGGVWLSSWALGEFVQSVQKAIGQQPGRLVQPTQLCLLDVGCGLGDIPRALRAIPHPSVPLRVIATDVSSKIIRIAQAADPLRCVTYAAADGLRLPFADGSVDVAHCSFTLHHFAPEQAVVLLAEMRRVSQRGVIVNDIVRSWPGLVGAWLLGRMISRNRLTRHDGLASARRAYTSSELCGLAARAGLTVLAKRELPGYRVVLALEK